MGKSSDTFVGDVAQMGANVIPVQHARARAGDHVLFMAGIRSNLAKKGGEALSDVDHRDVDRAGRYPAPDEIGTGGELVPTEPDLRDTVKNPDRVTVDATRDRLALASGAGVLEMALDASDTIAAALSGARKARPQAWPHNAPMKSLHRP